MRIVMVSNNYTPYSGGVVSALDAIIPALHAAGHDVTLITLSFLDNHADDPSWVVRVPHVGQWLYKKNHIAIPWRSDYHVLRTIKKIAPDIIHSHHPFLLGNCARKAAHELKIPLAFTYHTVYEQHAQYLPVPVWLGAPCIKKVVQDYCAQADGIITPSKAVHAHVQRQLPAETCLCVVIPSGLLPVFIPSGAFAPKKRHAQEPFKLLTVGRFVPEKNMRGLLDLFAQLDQQRFRFTLIGYGSEFDAVASYAYDTLGLSSDAVRFMHKPEKTLIAAQYREADLFLFGSTKDTQGLVLAESMAAGTPVIACDGPGQRDSVRQGINGFLVNSIEEMREKIMLLAGNPELHGALPVW